VVCWLVKVASHMKNTKYISLFFTISLPLSFDSSNNNNNNKLVECSSHKVPIALQRRRKINNEQTGVFLVGRPIADSLPTKWLPVNHRSGIGQRKSASQRPMP